MDVKKIRKDFKMLDNVMMQGHPLIYFDNAATTLKPQCVGETVMRFYNEFTSNVHRGDSAGNFCRRYSQRGSFPDC